MSDGITHEVKLTLGDPCGEGRYIEVVVGFASCPIELNASSQVEAMRALYHSAFGEEPPPSESVLLLFKELDEPRPIESLDDVGRTGVPLDDVARE